MTRFDGFSIENRAAIVERVKPIKAGPITIPTFSLCIPKEQN